jgi:ABC-type nitrate/sulfonate/bicarbonate transport system ATPase subunit
MGAVAFRLTGARKVYGHLTVFDGLDLEVRAGERFALVGSSGCGKSTLLRVLAGLEDLDAGTLDLAVDGRPHDRRGIVFQDPLLLPWLDVRRNVALGLRYRSNAAVRDDDAVDETLALFGLAALAGARPAELSGGQAQRVALARTVVTRPDLLLLDEPFSALDPASREALGGWLLDVHDRLGLTVVLVTHDVDEALRLGDRVGIIAGPGAGVEQIWETGAGADLPGIRRELLAGYRTDVRGPWPLLQKRTA